MASFEWHPHSYEEMCSNISSLLNLCQFITSCYFSVESNLDRISQPVFLHVIGVWTHDLWITTIFPVRDAPSSLSCRQEINCRTCTSQWSGLMIVHGLSYKLIFLVQVQLRTEVLCTPSSTRSGFELMTSRSWQYIPCHWDACSNHSAITDFSLANDYFGSNPAIEDPAA